MKQINIKRVGATVVFDPCSVDVTETVFFTNLDADPDPAKATHWPWFNAGDRPYSNQPFSDNQLGPYPSPNSSQCTFPAALPAPPTAVTYGCKFHAGEKGTINVFAVLAAANQTLKPATKGTAIPAQQVVTGGKSPYAISQQQFQVTNSQGAVIQSGSGSIGPGLVLTPDPTNNKGITVSGTPTVSGTYNFTFMVTDGMKANLQQAQYSMTVA